MKACRSANSGVQNTEFSCQGKIIKDLPGFIMSISPEKGVYECKAKGIFRKNKIKPLVGDDVVIDILDEEKEKEISGISLPGKMH